MEERENGSEELTLQSLRAAIDAVDDRLVDIIRERLLLIDKVARLKKKDKLPLHSPDREAELIAARRARAVARGVCPDLVEDVFRRVIQVSYRFQEETLASDADQGQPVG